jgi:hypothetical protein
MFGVAARAASDPQARWIESYSSQAACADQPNSAPDQVWISQPAQPTSASCRRRRLAVLVHRDRQPVRRGNLLGLGIAGVRPT